MAITRFAPSPTGYLHIGGLRTALYCYLWAKKTNGEFKLRIEDTDEQRNNQDAVQAILNAFEWVGMPSDCTIEYQSQRIDIYKKYVKELLDSNKAYKCYMSKSELDELREEQEKNKETPRYDGRWRPEEGKSLPVVPIGVEPVIRIKAPLYGQICFRDGIKGDMQFDANQVDDFVIARSNGMPTYNFVVAIDDHLMNITDVIRGDDHLNNTPKQIVVYNALGFDIPNFFHIPMINNPEGKKLSKRDGAMDVMDFRRQGYLPEALLNFLVRLGWSNKDQEIFSMDELVELFDPNNINKSASAYNEEKLKWLNSHYIKHTSDQTLIELLKNFDCNIIDHRHVEKLIEVSKERAQTLLELKGSIEMIINKPKTYDIKSVKKFIKEDTVQILHDYVNLLEKNEDNDVANIESFTKPFIVNNGFKFPQVFQPIRLALTGGTQAPSVYDLIYILGKQEVISRIETAIESNFN